MLTRLDVQTMLNKVGGTITDETDSEEPNYVIYETLLWVLGERQDYDIIMMLPDQDEEDDEV